MKVVISLFLCAGTFFALPEASAEDAFPLFPDTRNLIDAMLPESTSKPEVIRAQFIEVERIARMDHRSQKAHLRRLYFTLLPEFRKKYVIGLSLRIPPIDTTTGSPEQIADRFLADKNCGAAELNSEALSQCREILKLHPDEVGPWLWVDREGVESSYVLSQHYFPWLSGLLNQPDNETATRAARWLCLTHDPRAVSPIVRRFPSLRPASGKGFDLTRLQEGHPANPDLVRLLSSADINVRLLATEALSQSGDPALSVHGERLLKDSNEEIRKLAETLFRCIKKRQEDPNFPSGFMK